MTEADKRYFDHIPRDVGGGFVIHLYAAIYRLLNQVRRLSDAGGTKLQDVFDRHPFLAEYFNEMRRFMPEEISWEEGVGWWRRQILAWEDRCDVHLPLRALATETGLGFSSRLAFMAAGLVEEDSRFGALFAELQEPLAHRRPTLETVGWMMLDETRAGVADPWTICRPLLDMGLVEASDRQAPRSEWALKAPPLLWDAVRGLVENRPAPWCIHHPLETLTPMSDLIVDADTLSRLEKIPGLVNAGVTRMVIVRAAGGANTTEVMGAISRGLGKGLLAIDGASLKNDGGGRLLGPLCAMTNTMPLIQYDPGPGETVKPPMPRGCGGPIGVALGLEGGLSRSKTEKAVTFTLPTPDAALRRRHWQSAINGHRFHDLDLIARRFRLPGDFIRQAAEIAVVNAGLEGREEVRIDDVRAAGRALNRQLLDALAAPMETHDGWTHLVTGETTSAKLRELYRRCRHRERLPERLGPAFGPDAGCGVRALFTGPSGTGKTLAAKILAAELGMDLYRVDLAAIINKYIGETEKNLHRVLSRSEALDVALLLDEGDSLLGSRTEVKSANDRYANMETNYLLQRLESYQGIVLITTNLVENVDRAFQRRMDVVVPFFPPQAEERLTILQLHLPVDHAVDARFLEMAALRCALNGGQLRNASLHAVLLALDDDDDQVRDIHLEKGLRGEYRKAGATFPLEAVHKARGRDGGVEAFMGAVGAG